MQRSGVSSGINLLFSVALVATGLACLGFAWKWNTKSTEDAEIALGLSALEDSLLSGIANAEKPDGPFFLQGQSLGHSFQHSIQSDQILTLGKSFESCQTYPSEECGYKIRFTFDPKRFATTYEVTSAYARAPLSLKADGRNAITIPTSTLASSSLIACDSRNSVAVNGYSSSSGLSCLLKPQNVCAPGSLPKGVVVTGVVPRLEFICGEPSRVARCPAHYSFEKIETETLGTIGKVQATCVRTTVAVASPPNDVPPAGRISGRVCPYGYKSESSCSLVNVVAKPGRCGGKGPLVQPVPGKIEFAQNASVGFVDCGVRLLRQSCGAWWSAQAQLKIRCVLDQPERVNVQ